MQSASRSRPSPSASVSLRLASASALRSVSALCSVFFSRLALPVSKASRQSSGLASLLLRRILFAFRFSEKKRQGFRLAFRD